jgi:hypothetical protein
MLAIEAGVIISKNFNGFYGFVALCCLLKKEATNCNFPQKKNGDIQ